MKAIKINEEIKVYSELPNSWKGVMGNFSMLSEEEIKAYGFYDVVTPDYNPAIQDLSDIFWQEANQVFTYTVSDKEFEKTIEELKEEKIEQLKRKVNYQIAKTDWYITRKIERDINIPSSVTTERNNIFSECETKEAEINALTNKADVVTYEIVFNYESNE